MLNTIGIKISVIIVINMVTLLMIIQKLKEYPPKEIKRLSVVGMMKITLTMKIIILKIIISWTL